MEIITSYSKTEFEQIIEASIKRVINGNLPKPETPDLLNLQEACRFTGLKAPTIYAKTSQGTMPCSRYGNRLIFSRKELEQWMSERTIRKQSPSAIVTKQLQKSVKKKLR